MHKFTVPVSYAWCSVETVQGGRSRLGASMVHCEKWRARCMGTAARAGRTARGEYPQAVQTCMHDASSSTNSRITSTLSRDNYATLLNLGNLSYLVHVARLKFPWIPKIFMVSHQAPLFHSSPMNNLSPLAYCSHTLNKSNIPSQRMSHTTGHQGLNRPALLLQMRYHAWRLIRHSTAASLTQSLAGSLATLHIVTSPMGGGADG